MLDFFSALFTSAETLFYGGVIQETGALVLLEGMKKITVINLFLSKQLCLERRRIMMED